MHLQGPSSRVSAIAGVNFSQSNAPPCSFYRCYGALSRPLQDKQLPCCAREATNASWLFPLLGDPTRKKKHNFQSTVHMQSHFPHSQPASSLCLPRSITVTKSVVGFPKHSTPRYSAKSIAFFYICNQLSDLGINVQHFVASCSLRPKSRLNVNKAHIFDCEFCLNILSICSPLHIYLWHDTLVARLWVPVAEYYCHNLHLAHSAAVVCRPVSNSLSQ